MLSNWQSVLKQPKQFNEQGYFPPEAENQQYVLTNYFNKPLADKLLSFLRNKPMYFHKVVPGEHGDINSIKSDGEIKVNDPNKGDKFGDNPDAVYTEIDGIYGSYNHPTIGIITNIEPKITGKYALFYESVPINDSLIPEFNAGQNMPIVINEIVKIDMAVYNLENQYNWPEYLTFAKEIQNLTNSLGGSITAWVNDLLPEIVKWIDNPEYNKPIEPEGESEFARLLGGLSSGKN